MSLTSPWIHESVYQTVLECYKNMRHCSVGAAVRRANSVNVGEIRDPIGQGSSNPQQQQQHQRRKIVQIMAVYKNSNSNNICDKGNQTNVSTTERTATYRISDGQCSILLVPTTNNTNTGGTTNAVQSTTLQEKGSTTSSNATATTTTKTITTVMTMSPSVGCMVVLHDWYVGVLDQKSPSPATTSPPTDKATSGTATTTTTTTTANTASTTSMDSSVLCLCLDGPITTIGGHGMPIVVHSKSFSIRDIHESIQIQRLLATFNPASSSPPNNSLLRHYLELHHQQQKVDSSAMDNTHQQQKTKNRKRKQRKDPPAAQPNSAESAVIANPLPPSLSTTFDGNQQEEEDGQASIAPTAVRKEPPQQQQQQRIQPTMGKDPVMASIHSFRQRNSEFWKAVNQKQQGYSNNQQLRQQDTRNLPLGNVAALFPPLQPIGERQEEQQQRQQGADVTRKQNNKNMSSSSQQHQQQPINAGTTVTTTTAASNWTRLTVLGTCTDNDKDNSKNDFQSGFCVYRWEGNKNGTSSTAATATATPFKIITDINELHTVLRRVADYLKTRQLATTHANNKNNTSTNLQHSTSQETNSVALATASATTTTNTYTIHQLSSTTNKTTTAETATRAALIQHQGQKNTSTKDPQRTSDAGPEDEDVEVLPSMTITHDDADNMTRRELYAQQPMSIDDMLLPEQDDDDSDSATTETKHPQQNLSNQSKLDKKIGPDCALANDKQEEKLSNEQAPIRERDEEEDEDCEVLDKDQLETQAPVWMEANFQRATNPPVERRGSGRNEKDIGVLQVLKSTTGSEVDCDDNSKKKTGTTGSRNADASSRHADQVEATNRSWTVALPTDKSEQATETGNPPVERRGSGRSKKDLRGLELDQNVLESKDASKRNNKDLGVLRVLPAMECRTTMNGSDSRTNPTATSATNRTETGRVQETGTAEDSNRTRIQESRPRTPPSGREIGTSNNIFNEDTLSPRGKKDLRVLQRLTSFGHECNNHEANAAMTDGTGERESAQGVIDSAVQHNTKTDSLSTGKKTTLPESVYRRHHHQYAMQTSTSVPTVWEQWLTLFLNSADEDKVENANTKATTSMPSMFTRTPTTSNFSMERDNVTLGGDSLRTWLRKHGGNVVSNN